MILATFLLMTLLAWRLGVFEELVSERLLKAHDKEVWLEIDEADWEDRQEKHRQTHAPRGHRRVHMSLGRRR